MISVVIIKFDANVLFKLFAVLHFFMLMATSIIISCLTVLGLQAAFFSHFIICFGSLIQVGLDCAGHMTVKDIIALALCIYSISLLKRLMKSLWKNSVSGHHE